MSSTPPNPETILDEFEAWLLTHRRGCWYLCSTWIAEPIIDLFYFQLDVYIELAGIFIPTVTLAEILSFGRFCREMNRRIPEERRLLVDEYMGLRSFGDDEESFRRLLVIGDVKAWREEIVEREHLRRWPMMWVRREVILREMWEALGVRRRRSG